MPYTLLPSEQHKFVVEPGQSKQVGNLVHHGNDVEEKSVDPALNAAWLLSIDAS